MLRDAIRQFSKYGSKYTTFILHRETIFLQNTRTTDFSVGNHAHIAKQKYDAMTSSFTMVLLAVENWQIRHLCAKPTSDWWSATSIARNAYHVPLSGVNERPWRITDPFSPERWRHCACAWVVCEFNAFFVTWAWFSPNFRSLIPNPKVAIPRPLDRLFLWVWMSFNLGGKWKLGMKKELDKRWRAVNR